MRTTLLASLLATLATTGLAQSGEPTEEPEEKQPVRQIRVLEHPYDIASFYRSSQDGYTAQPRHRSRESRHPIASYYRSDRVTPRFDPYLWAPDELGFRPRAHRARAWPEPFVWLIRVY